jgi:hypothetical protein
MNEKSKMANNISQIDKHSLSIDVVLEELLQLSVTVKKPVTPMILDYMRNLEHYNHEEAMYMVRRIYETEERKT